VQPAGEHFVVHVLPVAQTLTERVQPCHLAAPQLGLLGRRTAPEGAVEGDVRLHGTGQIKDLGDGREGAALITEDKSLFVAMHAMGDPRNPAVPRQRAVQPLRAVGRAWPGGPWALARSQSPLFAPR